jgi:hypothetical protein
MPEMRRILQVSSISEGLSNPEEVKGGRRPTFIHLMNRPEAEN